jgi:hypothetical protein
MDIDVSEEHAIQVVSGLYSLLCQISPNLLTLKMVVVCTAETSGSTHKATGCRNLVDHNMHNLRVTILSLTKPRLYEHVHGFKKL